MGEAIQSQILQLDGMDFEVFMCGNQDSDKLALFLHGFPECAHTWRDQMPVFAQLGYKCWAPNQRGYGQSYKPDDVAEYKMTHLMEDVVRFIKASGCKTVTLISHDWGGVVAWNYSIQKFGPLDRLVVMNCPHLIAADAELRKWPQLKKTWYMLAFQIPSLFEYLFTRKNGELFHKIFFEKMVGKNLLTVEDADVYRLNALRPGGMKAMLDWYRALYRYKSSEGRKLFSHRREKSTVPTLLIWGERDVVFGVNTSRGAEKYIDHLTVQYLPEAGHFVQEEAPQRVNEILSAWLKENPL